VADMLADASARRRAVVPWGGGSHQHFGRAPIRCDTLLRMHGLSGVLAYAPDDLTVSVGAGTTLAELDAELAKHRQFLPLDVARPEASTIGGAVATSASSIRRSRYGGARDLVIGMTVALADGTICKAGGRVVKNVAGYDLCKLFTGSLGTLGVLLSVNLKVYPVPNVRRLALGTFKQPRDAFECARGFLRCSHYYAFVIVEVAEPSGPARIWALVEGYGGEMERQLTAARDLITACGGEIDVLNDSQSHPEIRRLIAYREGPEHTEPLLRGAVKPAQLHDAWLAACQAFPDGNMRMSGDATTGTYTIGIGVLDEGAWLLLALEELRAALQAIGGHMSLTGGSASLRASLDPWGASSGAESLSRIIKSRLDPLDVLNPGRYAHGI
jgi:glycolate oxidase FAD binding subunit